MMLAVEFFTLSEHLAAFHAFLFNSEANVTQTQRQTHSQTNTRPDTDTNSLN